MVEEGGDGSGGVGRRGWEGKAGKYDNGLGEEGKGPRQIT